MKECDVIRDLLPLYIDQSCSEDSRDYVDAHIAGCESCRAVRDAAQKTVQTMLTGKKAKKSFSAFRRKTRMKKTLLIVLCTALSLVLLTAILYTPIDLFLNAEWNAPIAPVQPEFSELPDGSVLMRLGYDDSLYVHAYRHTVDPNNPDTLYVTPKYTLMWQISEFWNGYISLSGDPNGNYSIPFVFTTNESAENYRVEPEEGVRLYINEHLSTHGPFTKVILRSSDGERVIWTDGDKLPTADARGLEESEFYLNSIISVFSATLPPNFPTCTPALSATPLPTASPQTPLPFAAELP